MLIRPELQALRGNDAPQRLAQAAIREVYDRWRAEQGGAALEQEVERYGRGADLDDLPLLATLFAPGDPGARRFAENLIGVLVRQLAAAPLSQSPLRYALDDTIASLILARHDTTTLTLQAIDGAGLARKPDPVSVAFAAVECHEHVLAGEGEATLVEVAALYPDRADLIQRPVALRPGTPLRRAGARQALVLNAVSGSLVRLKLQRRSAAGDVTREHALADGRLIHQAAGSPRESRLELATALLGRMGRADAAPLLAAMAEEDGLPSLRWQALRECLGLDTGTGFVALCRIARRPADPLSAPAGALRAQLLEAHPELNGLCPCPA